MLASIDTQDESKLIEQIHEGSSEARLDAFEALVKRHSPRLLKYLAGQGLASDEQQDVANETWLRVWLGLNRFEYRKEVGFFPWVRAYAKNIIREFERQHYLTPDPDPLEPELDDPKATNEALVHLTHEEMQATIEALLPTVPNADWGIVIEALVADLWRTTDIMELHGWSRSKTDTTKYRALAWLKKRLLEIVGPTDLDAWLSDP